MSNMLRVVNVIARFILRSPLHGVMSKNIMLISFTGRQSGKHYTVPISYVQDGDTVIGFTDAKWARNLRGGALVTLWVRGRAHAGTGTAISDPAAVAAGLDTFFRRLPRDARFYNVRLDAQKQPNQDDIARVAPHVQMLCVALTTASAASPQRAQQDLSA